MILSALTICDVNGDRPLVAVERGKLPALVDYLPNTNQAQKDWAKLRETWRLGAGEPEEEGDGDIYKLQTPLTAEEVARMRYARSWEPRGDWVKLGPRWGRGLSLLVDLSPYGKLIEGRLRDLGLFEFKSAAALMRCLKELGGVSKKWGVLVTDTDDNQEWKDMTDLHTLGGYAAAADNDAFVEGIKEWVGPDKVHALPNRKGVMSEKHFIHLFEEGLDAFWDHAPGVMQANAEAVGIDTFAEQFGYWANSGSSTTRERVRYTWREKGRVRTGKVKKNKENAAAILSAEHVRGVLRSNSIKQSLRAIPKKEHTGKVRPVIAGDDYMYLLQSFVSNTWLETALKGHPWSTLWKSKRELITMWELMANRCDTRDGVKMPLDQSHFDWQPNKEMWKAWFRSLIAFLKRADTREGHEDRLKNVLKIRDEIIFGSYSIRVEMGGTATVVGVEGRPLLSGWRWTSLVGTTFNIGMLLAMRKQAAMLGCAPSQLQSFLGTGDDDAILTQTWGYGILLAGLYEAANFEVHPLKFFMDRERDEFLRQVAEPGQVSGYLSRIINSILWRNPISRDPPRGLLRAEEQATTWNTAAGRGARPVRVKHHMVRDIGEANGGLSHDEVLRILHTPKALGGIGFWPVDPSLEFLALRKGRTFTRGRIIMSNVAGGREALKQIRDSGLDVSDSEFEGWWKDRLELMDAPVEVEPGRVEEPTRLKVARLPRYKWDGSRGWPLKARPSKQIGKTFAMDALRTALAQRRPPIDWIESVWLDPAQRDFSVTIRKRGKMSIWRDWLTDNLPYSTPIIEGWSALKPSVIAEDLAGRYWMWLNRPGGPTYGSDSVRRSALAVELMTRSFFSEWRGPRLGG